MAYHGKTMLTAYMLIDNLVKQIENLIQSRARNSFFNFSSTFEQAEKILKLTEIRLDLIALKEITKNALDSLSEEDRVLIFYKYFKINPKDKDFDLTSRNYFRKQNKAIIKFEEILKRDGYTDEWFEKNYLKIAFIAGIYKKIIKDDGKKHVAY